ncbi:hypothetical protein FOFC_09611, partial [Fusarium oxysporum]
CCDESSPGEETAPEQRETLSLQQQSQAQAQARVPMSWPTPDSLSRASHARPYPSITNLVCLSSGRAAGRSLKIGYWQPAGAKNSTLNRCCRHDQSNPMSLTIISR